MRKTEASYPKPEKSFRTRFFHSDAAGALDFVKHQPCHHIYSWPRGQSRPPAARDHSSSSPTFYGNPHDSPDPHASHASHVPRQYRPYRTIRPEPHAPPDLPTALRTVGAHQHMHHTLRTALPRSTHHTSRLTISRASRRPPRTPTARAYPTISSTRRRGASSCSTCTVSRNLTPRTIHWPRPLSFPSL